MVSFCLLDHPLDTLSFKVCTESFCFSFGDVTFNMNQNVKLTPMWKLFLDG
jgi:hypothetical protein